MYYIISVSNGNLNSDRVKSSVVKIIESEPVVEPFVLRGLDSSGNISDRIDSGMSIVISPSIDQIFHSDSGTNKSIIKWFVNDALMKSGEVNEVDPNGIKLTEIKVNEIGKEQYSDYAIRITNGIFAQIIAATETTFSNVVVQSPGIVVQNAIPEIHNLKFSDSVYSQSKDLVITYDFWDFEIVALTDLSGQSEQTILKWYRKNYTGGEFELVYSANLDGNNTLQETFDDENFYNEKIITDFVEHKSTILSSALNVGQQYYAELKPFDGIDEGSISTTKTVIITSS